MSYLSAIIYTFMIPNFNELVNGSSLSLPAHGRAGARATPFLAALFAKQKTKFGGGEKARAGKNSFPPTPFLFARPSEFSEISVGIFAEKSSDFVQETQPICKVCVSRLARGFASARARRNSSPTPPPSAAPSRLRRFFRRAEINPFSCPSLPARKRLRNSL